MNRHGISSTYKHGRGPNGRSRYAFTLIELLIVVAIMGLLASAVLFASWGVMEDAKTERTKSQIARIDAMLNDRWESYRSRSVPMSIPAGTNQRIAAGTRLAALRELMRMEMPERVTDLQYDPVILKDPSGAVFVPSLARAHRRRAIARAGPLLNWGSSTSWTTAHEGAECLYLILENIQAETGEGSLLARSEVGDVDGDGMPEVLDSWGRPIEFLRWAPGFLSARQSRNAVTDPDPFDPLKVDPRWANAADDPFLLFPLVFSAGPDGHYDINIGTVIFSTTSPPNDPYYADTSGNQNGTQMDTDVDGTDSYMDNLHNHSIEVK